jgi:hypothetical protein
MLARRGERKRCSPAGGGKKVLASQGEGKIAIAIF